MAVFNARRKAPEKVEPLVHAGIRYETTVNGREFGFAQDGGVLLAFDEKSGEQLWVMQVYAIDINEKFERDAQICYITRITLSDDGKALWITNERRKQFSVNLADRVVTPLE